MGCNCGKAKQDFKNFIQQNRVVPIQPPQPKTPMTRAERIRLRGIRIQARNARIEARNKAILAVQKSKENNLGNQ